MSKQKPKTTRLPSIKPKSKPKRRSEGVIQVDSSTQRLNIKQFLDQSLQAYKKLPMLNTIFERFLQILSSSLRSMTLESMEFSGDRYKTTRFSEYVEHLQMNSTVVVFKIVELDNFGLLVLDDLLVNNFIYLLLGGKLIDKKIPYKPSHNRSLTLIEQGIIYKLAEMMLGDLASAFEQVYAVSIVFQKFESVNNLATLAKDSDHIALFDVNIDIAGNKQGAAIVIPYKTLEPIKKRLQHVFFDKAEDQSSWSDVLLRSMQDMHLDLDVVLMSKKILLQSLLRNLKVGNTIVTDHHVNQEMIVRSSGVEICYGKIGKVQDVMAVVITSLGDKNSDIKGDLKI
ncbi:Flagellar motor switch protein FliM [Rickettsiales endosymbiont of Paramecium tredecaurelia]|uniref:FliM/FliN family flagellar motor switch protein n=1 Tax=Candidatus Sarmatiella mevalonica TaxID=2770581 RepID=UPI001921D9C5|nr:FliM/FliN family flagellar motor switch protein [Candidatus Sarmatiella mevalonica]MBL3284754.1 Flagellar motor switch protein FliM [Candidatus Sarmatiella mevalonica]